MNKNFKNKKILLAHWDSENKKDNVSQNWYSPLKEIFGEVITFSPKNNYFKFGKEAMNKMLLDLIEKEKPDYIFFLLIYDELDPNTFSQIKIKFPNIKTISFNSDDSWRFEDYYQYYSLFFDYLFAASAKALPFYKEKGIKNVHFSCGINLDHFKPYSLGKKYDVIFIGRPGKSRAEYLKFLAKSGIKIAIWGDGWAEYKELKNYYHGILSAEDWPKVVSQSKINLSFSMGGDNKPQFKGRPMEVSACRSFCLIEYCDDYFKVLGKNNAIMFMDKEEMLEKIKYYLSHDKKREEIANRTYKRMVEHCDVKKEIINLISEKISKNKQKLNFKDSEKVIYLTTKDFEDIKNKTEKYDYICFKTNAKINPLKDFIQVYSLRTSNKNISCCDYYVSSEKLGNYLLYKSKQSFDKLGDKANLLLTPAQIMIKKDYFLKNIEKFKRFFYNKNEVFDKKEIIFVSIPLVSINNIKNLLCSDMEKSFQMKFLDNLYSRFYLRKHPLSYLFNLIINSFSNKLFILKILRKSIFDKSKIYKVIKGF